MAIVGAKRPDKVTIIITTLGRVISFRERFVEHIVAILSLRKTEEITQNSKVVRIGHSPTKVPPSRKEPSSLTCATELTKITATRIWCDWGDNGVFYFFTFFGFKIFRTTIP